MHITLIPQRRDEALTLSRAGDVLSLNGQTLDLSAIPPGATLPAAAVACDWIAGPISRDADGTLSLSLILPHGPAAPPETLFPPPITVTGDGPVALPAYTAPEEAAE